MESIVYELPYYIYILFFGMYVSMRLVHGALRVQEWRIFAVAFPSVLLLQGVSLQLWGMEKLWLIYPLITHLPIMLVLMLWLKAKWDAALVSVVISYSLCQLLRWVGLVIYLLDFSPIAAAAVHIAGCQLLLLLLDRFCLNAVHNIIARSGRSLRWFGGLPMLYYLYDYFMRYTQNRYKHILAFDELLPTELVLFYILFATAYQRETEKRRLAEHQNAALELRLDCAEHEIGALRILQEKTAIHRHDLRHHLMMIDGLLAVDKRGQAEAYIRSVCDGIEAIVPQRFCENETVNLLLCAFCEKAKNKGAEVAVKAPLPPVLNLPDTELCVILSNGLENALNAVLLLPEGEDRTIEVFCGLRQSKLLIEIKNSCAGSVEMRDGLPLAKGEGHGYGCRSIQSIVQRRRGLCSFETVGRVFVLRVAIPIPDRL